MSKIQRDQQLLNWLENEKKKDSFELEKIKKDLVNQIKKTNKQELFPKPEKISIWKKIKIMIWG